MITAASVFTFLNSKLGKSLILMSIIAFIIAGITFFITHKESKVKQREKEIEKQKEDINKLNIENQKLKNEIEFIKENDKFKDSFSNSSVMINNLSSEDLTRKEYETFYNISNNFYKYFRFNNLQKSNKVKETVSADFYSYDINFMLCKNKIYQNTAFLTAENLYYKTNHKQTGFNEKLSGEYHKNRRMAVMV
ncbi:hypothetical protein [Brachyspira sp.]|uniref:hypothetical protein n=1 Tax=Brachyspira sp. TaxID=1977261 RepID=UPI0026096F48|nr:hypothetical protein [Brachyspira sp.]